MNRRTIIGFLSFAVMVAGLVVVLKFVNWLPYTIRKDTLRSYESIEQMRAALNIRDVYIPSYFPQNITWPPAKILAQDSPFPALIMEFRQAEKNDIILVLSQSSGGTLPALYSFDLTNVRETVPFGLHGSKAVLMVGECGTADVCSRIAWTEEGYAVTATLRGAPSELSKIVGSMHP